MSSTVEQRQAGALCLAGGGLTALVAVLVQVLVVPGTHVSDKVWSYPWSASALVPVSVGYTLLHLLVLAGLFGILRSGVIGVGRAARAGRALVLSGTVLLTIGELASIPIRQERLDSTPATIVGAVFGVAVLFSVIGLLTAGITALHSHRWYGWRRLTPLTAGIFSAPLIVLGSTHFLATGVALYGGSLALVGLAFLTAPEVSTTRNGAAASA
jgi:hypothetical protein